LWCCHSSSGVAVVLGRRGVHGATCGVHAAGLIVYCQPLQRQAEALPAVKVLVTPVEYVPEKTTNTI
jgi:hypothetical protein